MHHLLPNHTARHRGFTIIELIVVIAVIAILAALILVGYIGMQSRAQAGDIVNGLKDIEKSLRGYASENQWTAWPLDTAIDPSVPAGHPTIAQLVTDVSGFNQYLQTAPSTPTYPASTWTYHSTATTISGCTSNYNGTSIQISNISSSVASYVDTDIDDGNTSCGRVRYDATASVLIYIISYSSDLNI